MLKPVATLCYKGSETEQEVIFDLLFVFSPFQQLGTL